MITGSCLCGQVAYQAAALSGPMGHCHCRTCQKAHSAAFATTARVRRAEFAWTKGGDAVAGFESTPGKTRWFCPRCGSHLMAERNDTHEVILRIGRDDLPRFEEGAPQPPA